MVGGSQRPELAPYTVYVEVNSGEQRTFGSKRRNVSAGLIAGALACVALTALVLSPSANSGNNISTAQKQADVEESSKLAVLEQEYAEREIMHSMVRRAVAGCPADVQTIAAHIATRAEPQSLATAKTSMLAADCARKATYDTILKQFEELHANITKDKNARDALYSELKTAQDSSYEAWLAAESTYRDNQNKHKTAQDAATYAQGQLEKYEAAVKQAKEHMVNNVEPLAAESKALATQKALIGTISELVKNLQTADTKAQQKDVLRQVSSDIEDLKASQASLPAKGRKELSDLLATSTSLSASSSSIDPATVAEAMKILTSLSATIDSRLAQITTETTKAQTELDTNGAQKRHWEIQVVELGNQADKAEAAMKGADLSRSKLAGVYSVKKRAYEDDKASYANDSHQFSSQLSAVALVVSKIKQLVSACTTAPAATA